MHKIAFIIENRFVYWTPILIALGVLAAVCMFLALHLGRTGKAAGAFVAVPLALVLSLVLGRLAYWACVPERYDSLAQVLGDFGMEGFAFSGIVGGCVLSACVVRLLGLSKSLPAMLDAMSLAGLFGVAVGKLNHLFNYADRAVSVNTADGMPFSLYCANALTGELWQATFLLQAMASASLFIILLAFFMIAGRKTPGHTCLLVGFFYGAVQLMLDGMRYDALYLPGISAMTLVQLCSVFLMALPMVLFSIKMAKNRGWKWWYLVLWLPAVGAVSVSAVLAHKICSDPFEGIMQYCVTAAVSLLLAVLMLAARAIGKTVNKAD